MGKSRPYNSYHYTASVQDDLDQRAASDDRMALLLETEELNGQHAHGSPSLPVRMIALETLKKEIYSQHGLKSWCLAAALLTLQYICVMVLTPTSIVA